MTLKLLSVVAILLSTASVAHAYDYCAEGDERVTVLIDRTTRYDERDKDTIINGLDKIVKDLSPGTLLTLQTIVDTPANSDVAFSSCVPGCREQSILDWFTSSCSSIRARKEYIGYMEKFVNALRPLLSQEKEYPHSAIARTIRVSSEEADGRSVDRLIVYSDLLENSEIIPYRQNGYFNDAESAKSKIEKYGLLAKLDGTTVEVFGFGRSHNNRDFGDYDSGRDSLDPALEKRVRDFWEWYFKSSGAKAPQITREYSF